MNSKALTASQFKEMPSESSSSCPSHDYFAKELLWHLELSLCRSTSNGPHIPRGGWPGHSIPPNAPLPWSGSPLADVHNAWHQSSPGPSPTQAAKGSCLRRPTQLPRAPLWGTVESKSRGCQVVLLVSLP